MQKFEKKTEYILATSLRQLSTDWKMNVSCNVKSNNWRTPKDETIQIVQSKKLKKTDPTGYAEKVRLMILHDTIQS